MSDRERQGFVEKWTLAMMSAEDFYLALDQMLTEYDKLKSDKWERLLAIVEEQANDEGLWFITSTISEAYLQVALRRLHAEVEDEC